MSEYVIQAQTLTGIADAIRAHLGTEQQYTPESMAAAIGSIQGGGENLGAFISGDIVDLIASANKVRPFICYQMPSLERVRILNANVIGSSAFLSSLKLAIAVFDAATIFESNVFLSCSSLNALVILSDSVCSMSNANVLSGTPIASGSGYIYVPDSLVAQYKVATNWATYAAQIKSLSELPAEVQEWLDQQGGASA